MPARRDDCSRDAPCVAFLAEITDQLGEVALLETGNQIGGARPIASHAHVEWSVEAKGKPTLGAVELLRGNAEVERDTGDRIGRHRANQPLHIAEASFEQRQPARMTGGERGAALQRFRIAVDAKNPAARRGQQPGAVAAAAKRAVDIGFAVARRERRQCCLEQDRNVAHALRRDRWSNRCRAARILALAPRFGHDGRRVLPPRAGKVVPWRRERSRTVARCSA